MGESQTIKQQILTIWHEDALYQLPIFVENGSKFSLQEDDSSGSFPSLSDLITFYQKNALPIPPHCKLVATAAAADKTCLAQPTATLAKAALAAAPLFEVGKSPRRFSRQSYSREDENLQANEQELIK